MRFKFENLFVFMFVASGEQASATIPEKLTIDDIKLGTKVCFEFSDGFYNGSVVEHFAQEKLWHVVYADGDEQDMDDEEVVSASNLFMSRSAEHPITDVNSVVRAQPLPVSPQSQRTLRSANLERAREESQLATMIQEFDDLVNEADAIDRTNQNSVDVHETQRNFDDENIQDVDLDNTALADDQCSWCGFSDHRRKTRTSCPQHPDYNGDKYSKGAKISNAWVPGTRGSHRSGTSTPVTITSVRSAPLCTTWKTKDWTEGVGALESFEPQDFQGQSTLTYPKSQFGWDSNTPPRPLFDNFYKVLPVPMTVLPPVCDTHVY